MGRVIRVPSPDKENANRLNYRHSNAVNFEDGDSLSWSTYNYGVTSLINDQVRVYKGGSWADGPYYLSPGTRRFLDENQATATIGFRCAMSRVGSPVQKQDAGKQFKSRKK
jgi:formylglycine-generating enzyme required for sulfatase activity